MSLSFTERDKQVTKEIHALFWRAILKNKMSFMAALLGCPPFYLFVNVLLPLETAYGIQSIITRHFDSVGHHALLILIYSIAGCICYWIASLGINRNGIEGASAVQKEIFRNYLTKDYDFYSSEFIGALGAQAARLREACDDYNLVMLFDIPKVLTITIFSLLIIWLHAPLLAIVAIVAMIFTLSITIIISTLRLKYRRIVSELSSQLAGVLGDALSHAPAVKSFNKEEYEQTRLQQPLKLWGRAQLKSWDLAIPANALRYVLIALTTGALLIVSSSLYQQNKISIAIIALVQLYVIRLLTVTLEVGEIIKRYESIMSSAYQPVATMMVSTYVNDPIMPVPLQIEDKCAISFKNVSYKYPEAAQNSYAVQNFSLEVQPGEKIGLVGHSGGGKTTLSKLLMRFMDVTEGGIEINNVNIQQTRQTDVRNHIAYVPQEPVLFHRSIKENIAYAKPEATDDEISAVAKTAYVDEFATDLPHGYDTTVGERGVKLSGGQRQRVAIARALLLDAPILVLDEATSALDSESEKYIQKALWKLMKNRTAIVVAHRLSTIQRMDRIVVMDKGKIVQLGTHTELLKDKNGMYAKLWAHQSDGYIAEA